MNRPSAFLLLFVTWATACGGEQPPPAAPPPPPPAASEAPPAASEAPSASAAPPAASAAPSASAAPAAGGPPAAPGPGEWDSWSKEQKMAYMKAAVLPKMGGLFHDFDSKMFPDPKCVLCHGPGAKQGNFTMPNPSLPKLPATPEGFKKLKEQKAQVFEFMSTKVAPEMASLLGEQPFDMKTGKGFGCFGCHTKKK